MKQLNEEQKIFLKMDLLIFAVITLLFLLVLFTLNNDLGIYHYMVMIFMGTAISFFVKGIFGFLNKRRRDSTLFFICGTLSIAVFSFSFLTII
ncbi:hypothetical protein [Virgibacillus salexigens]|uniref:hypothetical protein n=1 Tax=Virgibacillus TaxID=84406 RepID=UPI001369A5DA|nr:MULTISPECIES: hypothetical protein [Virgibacillus]MYL43927.1 hypothetical protein [Virgibacillus massiliensis]